MFTQILLDHWGLNTERDKIQIRAIGDDSVLAQAVMTGVVDGAVLGYTYSRVISQRAAVSWSSCRRSTSSIKARGSVASRRFIDSSPDAVEKTLRALIRANRFIQDKNNQPAVIRSLRKWLRLAPTDNGEDLYNRIRLLYDRSIVPTKEGIKARSNFSPRAMQSSPNSKPMISSTTVSRGNWRRKDCEPRRFMRKEDRLVVCRLGANKANGAAKIIYLENPLKKLPSVACVSLLLLVAWAGVSRAASANRIVIAYSSLNERGAGALLVARDQGFFRKYDLDVQLIFMRNAAVALSALSAGEAQFYSGSANGSALGAMAGGLDLVFVAGLANQLNGTMVAAPAIHSPADLKGKNIGIKVSAAASG